LSGKRWKEKDGKCKGAVPVLQLLKRETGRQYKLGSTPLIGAGAIEASPKVFCQPSIFNRKVETKKEF
jgi:hypothetical protein